MVLFDYDNLQQIKLCTLSSHVRIFLMSYIYHVNKEVILISEFQRNLFIIAPDITYTYVLLPSTHCGCSTLTPLTIRCGDK